MQTPDPNGKRLPLGKGLYATEFTNVCRILGNTPKTPEPPRKIASCWIIVIIQRTNTHNALSIVEVCLLKIPNFFILGLFTLFQLTSLLQLCND